MSEAVFEGPTLKVKRTKALLEQLYAVEQGFWLHNVPEVVVDLDPETGNKHVKVRLTARPPELIHILAAEIIYHLRSALDQIAVALARLSRPVPNVKYIYFPTGDNLKAFEASRDKNTAGIEPDLVQLIEATKPYNGGNDTLRSIFPLANVDKHLELIPAANRGNLSVLSHFTVKGMVNGLVLDSRLHRLDEGITLFVLAPHGTFQANHSNAKIQVAGQVTFGNVSIYDGKPLLGTLYNLIDLVERLLQTFMDHCRRTGRI